MVIHSFSIGLQWRAIWPELPSFSNNTHSSLHHFKDIWVIPLVGSRKSKKKKKKHN